MPNCRPLLSAFLVLLSALGTTLVHANWPQFRGAGGQGQAIEQNPPLTWSNAANVRWRTAIVGRGWSSPVVWGDQVWLTTAIQRMADPEIAAERAKKLPGSASFHAMTIAASVSLRAVCVDRASGELLREVTLFDVDWPEPVHALNSYASPTPVIEPGRLYCHFGTWGTCCVDTYTGDVIWQTQYELQHYVGPGSSPVIHGDSLILTCDGADLQYVVALNKHTGAEVWKRNRPPIRQTNPDFRKSYCTPLVIQSARRDQVVIPGAQWTVAYNPQNGREIWRLDHGRGFSLVARPVFDGTRLFFCTGYGSAMLMAIPVDARGKLAVKDVIWSDRRQVPNKPSPVIANGLLFTVSDGGVAMCRDATSGRRHWQQRIPGKYSASPLAADGRIYFFSEEGRTTVIPAKNTFELLAENDMSETIMASPAVVDDALYLRTDEALYSIAQD